MIKKIKKNTFKALSLAVSAFVAAGMLGTHPLLSAKALSTSGSAGTTVTIFHTNDMHGHVVSTVNSSKVLSTIGADYVSAMKKNVPGSLLIDAGDASQGMPFATISKGADVVKIMNAAGYDGATLGNHEFDYGAAQALANAKAADFPVVSANSVLNGAPFLANVNGNNGKDFIKTVNGVKVGFFGITTIETAYKTNPATLGGVTFSDAVATSRTEVAALKALGAQVIVGIMHNGNDPSSNPTSTDIAKAVSGINVIIDGHSHTVENSVVNNTLIVQTGCYAANLGRVDIKVDDSGSISSTETLYTAAQVQQLVSPDSSVTALAAQLSASQQSLFKNVVGHTGSYLWGGVVSKYQIARLCESNMGDLITDALVNEAAKQLSGTKYAHLPIVGQEDGGSVRDSISAGNITQGQVETVMPYDDNLTIKLVTPYDIYAMLENGVSNIKVDSKTGDITGADGRYSQVSGMRFEYDPAASAGSRVRKVVLLNKDGSDGKEIARGDKATKIVLTASSYEARDGGDGYTMLSSLPEIGEGGSLSYVIEQYISNLTKASGGSIHYKASYGRIKALTTNSPIKYNASVTVSDDSGPVADTNVFYSVDSSPYIKGRTDASGILKLSGLSTGGHSVFILASGKSAYAYVNNVIGLGTDNVCSAAAGELSSDQKAAYGVIVRISNLPSAVALSDRQTVDKLNSAYKALTASQKEIVFNHEVLSNAAAKISALTQQKAARTANPAPLEKNPHTGGQPMIPLAEEGIITVTVSGIIFVLAKKLRV